MLIKTEYKPTITVPEGFRLVVDTREQKPLFTPDLSFVVVKKLDQGDYSVLGFEDVVAIERKSRSDLKMSLGVERKRFVKEIERLKEYEWKGLVIECEEKELYYEDLISSLSNNAVYQSLCSLELQGFHIYYASDRERAADWVLSRLVKFYKRKRFGR